MASMLGSLRHLRPVINGSLPLIIHLKTETWARLAIQRTAEARRMILLSRCFTARPRTDRRNAESEFDPSTAGMQKLDRILQRLDTEVRRVGRISMNDVNDILNEIKSTGSATSTQSLLLIRCCGSLLPEELPVNRTKLVSTVMELIQSKNIVLDVSHYNALLKVHLENEHKFSPTDFLAEMEAKKVEPNRVTYQRLISHYCQFGDVAGASKILEFMKSKNLPINENVFNALIQGHSKVGEMENAKSILEVMKASKLEPTSDSYLGLICGYAERGNIEEIRNVLSEAEKNDVSLLNKEILEIIYTLAVNGHSQHIDEMVTKLKKKFGYNQDVINVIYRLINVNQEDAAFKLLLTMPRSMGGDGEQLPIGQFFFRHIVKAERPIDKILFFCDELKKRNLNNVGLLRAAEASLVLKKTDYALKFINKLNEQEFPIRPHYFWPIFAFYKSTNNTQGIYDTLSSMFQVNCTPNFDTLLDYVYPSLSLVDPDVVIQKLKDLGLTVGAVVNPMVTYMMIERRLQVAAKLVQTYPVRLLGNTLLPHLARAAVETRDLPNALQVLNKVNTSRESNQDTDYNGQFLMDYYKLTDFNSQKLEELLAGCKQYGFPISSAAAAFVSSKFKGAVPTAINDMLTELQSSTVSSLPIPEKEFDANEPETFQAQTEMTLEELECHLTELKAKNMNTRGVMRRLLLLYCRHRELKKAEQIKSDLDAMGFNYSAAMYAALMELYTYNNDVTKALECRKLMYQVEPNFPLDDHKVIDLAALMVKNGHYDDGLQLIAKHHELHGTKDRPENLSRSNWRILNAVAETADPQLVQRFFDLLHSKGYAAPTNNVLGPLVKAYLLKNDLQGALLTFENCCKKYHCTPWKNELLMQFIKLEDAERLQKVVDMSSEIHGEMNTMYDLAYAFINSNQYKQARKILETPGLRARHQRLQSMCEKFLEENKLEQLEQLVHITKDLFDIDRDEMYYQLLRMYGKLDQPEKALGVWTSMQEESIQPKNRTLIYLAELLRKHNITVPFAVSHDDGNVAGASSVSDGKAEDLMGLIRNDKLDEALQLRRKLDGETNIRNDSLLIEALIRKERLNEATNIAREMFRRKQYPLVNVFKFLLGKLAAAGDIETIESIGGQIDAEVKRNVSFSNYISRAYIDSNRDEELLQWLEKGLPDNQGAFPNRGILKLLKKDPQYVERVHTIAKAYAAKEYMLPLNMIWVHHFTQENYDKADEILKANPKFTERLIFIDVVREARDKKNDSMARKLIDVIKSTHLNEQLKCTAYCGLIDVLCEKEEIEKALKVFEEGVQSGFSRSNFKETTLERLRSGLKQIEKPIPASLASQQTQQADSSSDSSSDSSEDEKEKRP